jgi:hypothetical protein
MTNKIDKVAEVLRTRSYRRTNATAIWRPRMWSMDYLRSPARWIALPRPSSARGSLMTVDRTQGMALS